MAERVTTRDKILVALEELSEGLKKRHNVVFDPVRVTNHIMFELGRSDQDYVNSGVSKLNRLERLAIFGDEAKSHE